MANNLHQASEKIVADMEQLKETPLAQFQTPRANSWWRVLLTGLLFFIVGLAVLTVTGNPVLFPTVVLLGNFMVPAAYVAFFYEHRYLSKLSMPTTALTFFYGGVLGVFAASILEPLFISRLDFFTAFGIGLIEEFAKILGVLVIARRIRHDSELDGLILGAAAGMGFAALESTGYAFSAFLRSGGSLSITVGVTLVRGLLLPLGHGTWTGILTGVLFRESRAGHFRLNRKVIGAYLTVAVLHGLWDGLPGLVGFLTGSGLDVISSEVFVAGLGLFILWRRWREAKRLELAQSQLISPTNDYVDIMADQADGH
jgi:RsiW-degrading membrane proteinase PrsW (M82 family)